MTLSSQIMAEKYLSMHRIKRLMTSSNPLPNVNLINISSNMKKMLNT